MILDRKDLREAQLANLSGAVLLLIAFAFRSEIEFYVGATATSWLLNIFLLLLFLSVTSMVGRWLDIRGWERTERRKKEEDERERASWEAEEKHAQAEYDAFLKWVKQNPKTADRLMAIVEHEQIDNPDYQTW
jgi:hypothetical protein